MFLAWVSRYSSANRSNSATSTASASRVAVGRAMGDDLIDQIERPVLALHIDPAEVLAENAQADQLGGREEDDDQGEAGPPRRGSAEREPDYRIDGQGE